ncbi:MAG: hypothetical protein NT106_08610 [Candidatus Sumerlaeota bacterium]|nr:hypothetical protein [Candidatus Sumerlaeota bacterium]
MPVIGVGQPAVGLASLSPDNGKSLDDFIAAKLDVERMKMASQPPAAVSSTRMAPSSEKSPASSLKKSTAVSYHALITADIFLIGIWFLGILLLIILTIRDHVRIHGIFARSKIPDNQLQILFNRLAGEMEIRRVPALHLTDDLESPAIVGILNPVVLFPRWLAESANADQPEWILRHELMHWKMKDPLALLLRRISEILFYFHPAVWFAGKRWEEAMELACDRALLQEEPDARHYAEHLYHLLENQGSRRCYPLAAGIFATRTQIGNRIAALLANPLRHPARLGVFSMICLLGVALIGFSTGFGVHGVSQAQNAAVPPTVNAQRNIPRLVEETRAALRCFEVAANAYLVDYNHIPINMRGLTTPIAYISRTIQDPFAPGEPIKMSLSGDSKEAIYYSVGPDGIDQKGALTYDPTNGVKSPGDILVILAQVQNETQTSRPSAPAPPMNDPFMNELLKMKEKDGRDNALIDYRNATFLMPKLQADQTRAINDVLKNGWRADSASLKPLLDAFQPVFAEVRKGAGHDYAKNVEYSGPATPVPNFLFAQTTAKMLCVEGRLLESQGKYRDALQNYITALTMGRDYGAPNTTLIGALISIAVEDIALRQVNRLVSSGNINDYKFLVAYCLPRLKAIESSTVTSADAFRTEQKCRLWWVRKFRENPEEFKRSNPEMAKALSLYGPQLADDWDKSDSKFWDIQLAYLETPYWKRNQNEFKMKMDEWAVSISLHPSLQVFSKVAVPNTLEADVRIHVTKSRMLQTQIATALESYRLINSRYPSRLSELAPQYFAELPVDVFNGREYIYKPSADGISYNLYGVGPDRIDDSGATVYDPTNGTISAGDLFYK